MPTKTRKGQGRHRRIPVRGTTARVNRHCVDPLIPRTGRFETRPRSTQMLTRFPLFVLLAALCGLLFASPALAAPPHPTAADADGDGAYTATV
ncbi:MAG: hypothetical protein NUV84_03170, partial [Candidatus Uhrbacteria bacterium]|nr:hypothetical protein [Candidatus Uhrbacteria bacterium]